MSRDNKLPAIQFYPGDWKKDAGVQTLSYHDRGVWFEILLLMHESERRGVLLLNGKAMSNGALARILGLDIESLKQTVETILEHGVASIEEDTGALMSRRMVRDEHIRQVRTEAGKQGGNPGLLKQIPSKTLANGKQIPTPSSSSSVSSSIALSGTEETHARLAPSEGGGEADFDKAARKKRFLDETHGEFYAGYWRKVSRQRSRDAWPKAIVRVVKERSVSAVEAAQFLVAQMLAQRRAIESRSDLEWLEKTHPASWLNGGAWNNEIPPPRFELQPNGKQHIGPRKSPMQEAFDKA
jgi:hypothetical protein